MLAARGVPSLKDQTEVIKVVGKQRAAVRRRELELDFVRGALLGQASLACGHHVVTLTNEGVCDQGTDVLVEVERKAHFRR